VVNVNFQDKKSFSALITFRFSWKIGSTFKTKKILNIFMS